VNDAAVAKESIIKESTNTKMEGDHGDGSDTEDFVYNLLPLLSIPANSAIFISIASFVIRVLAYKDNRYIVLAYFALYKKTIYNSIVTLVVGALFIIYLLHTEFTNCDAPRA